MRKVEVTAYNKLWSDLFEKESKLLKAVFGNHLLQTHHIGSTSVPGLQAKPIIDIMPVVKDINAIDQYNPAMTGLGYECKGENGLPGRRFYQKGGDYRTHHIHIYQNGNPEIGRHLAFRDFLRAHPEVVQEYGKLKQQLAERYPYDIEAYINGKHNLVQKIERQAMDWYKGTTP